MSENKYIFNETQITDIADATRKVTNTTEKMTVSEIAEKLNNYEAPVGGLDYMYLNDGWEGDIISEDITVVAPCAFTCRVYVDGLFQTFKKFGTIDLPNCTEGMPDSFLYTTITKSLNMPKLTTAGDRMFSMADLSSLTELNLPVLTTVGNGMFSMADLSSLTELNLPVLTTVGESMFSRADLSSLTELNLPVLTTVGESMFSRADLSSLTEEKLNEFLCRTDLALSANSQYEGYVFLKIRTNASKLKCKWKNIGVNMFGQLENADDTAKTTVKLWLSKDTKVSASDAYDGIFHDYSSSYTQVDIYTDATEKPDNWGTYFNYLTYSTQATVHYDVSEAEYDAL